MTEQRPGWWRGLFRPVDAAGLAVFRILFGAMMCLGSLRFLRNGWVERFFVEPEHYLSYWGFEWVGVFGPDAMTGIFWAMAALSAMVAVGFCYRFAIVGFALLFTYVELIDVANYLNHYYFVSLVAVILAFLPAHRRWSVDAWLRPAVRKETVPWLAYGWLRLQVAVVWLGAALAKVTGDWLLGAQPMNIWLNARVDVPFVGPVLDIWEVALVASWAGFLYDASIPFLLMWKKTRKVAFVAVIGFHVMTHILFNIGMFPLIMVVSATIFFAPDWPRRTSEAIGPTPTPSLGWKHRVATVLVGVWCVIQVVMPLRFLAYGDDDVLWHEQGMRWSWKVMCREKNGAVTFNVHLPDEGRRFDVPPRNYLTPHQEREMATQPDTILQMAHDIADDWRAKGHANVEVYADAIVSLNGRAPQPMIDPEVDLASIEDGVAPAGWILQVPQSPPPKIGRRLFGDPLLFARETH